MARTRPVERLDQLVDAATQVFIAKGYRRAQMADIARAMGVAPGTLYLYVESKEALFDLVVRQVVLHEPVHAAALPLPAPDPGATLDKIRAAGEERLLSSLEEALARDTVDDPRAELEGIIRQFYRRLDRNRLGIKLVEQSAQDWPEMADLFFRGIRGTFLAQLSAYLDTRIQQGLLRPVPDTAVAARLINETVAWFAMHRHTDRNPTVSDDALAEATTVDALVHAFILPEVS